MSDDTCNASEFHLVPKPEIEQLRERVKFLETCCLIEAMIANPNVDEAIADRESQLAAAQKENERLTKINAIQKSWLKIQKSWLDGMPFCPDHRDKQKGLSCRACEIERLEAALRRIRDHEHCDVENVNDGAQRVSDFGHAYGHRCCAAIAREGLGEE